MIFLKGDSGGVQINPGDIIQYEEPVRIFHRYLVLKIVKEDKESIMCDCLVYTGNGYTTVPYVVWKRDSYQYTTVIDHVDISKLNLLEE